MQEKCFYYINSEDSTVLISFHQLTTDEEIKYGYIGWGFQSNFTDNITVAVEGLLGIEGMKVEKITIIP